MAVIVTNGEEEIEVSRGSTWETQGYVLHVADRQDKRIASFISWDNVRTTD